ncbi:MAG: hypothetical protein U5K29_05590 [Acidimicrobiales bacterium]|nr:hypothetical protein [Acidimicrobiales bacterium]
MRGSNTRASGSTVVVVVVGVVVVVEVEVLVEDSLGPSARC